MTDNIISIQYDSDIAKGNEAVRISFYANIGFFIEVAPKRSLASVKAWF